MAEEGVNKYTAASHHVVMEVSWLNFVEGLSCHLSLDTAPSGTSNTHTHKHINALMFQL